MENLLLLKAILDKAGITFWLDAGTALFAFRNGTMDPSDTDLGIYGEDEDKFKVLQPLFEEAGFKFHCYDSPFGREYCVIKDGNKIDIWPKYNSQFGRYWYCFYRQRDWYKLIPYNQPSRHFEELDKITLLGTEFNIPCDTETFLEEAYGPTWRIPTSDWRWYESPPCINYTLPWVVNSDKQFVLWVQDKIMYVKI